MLSIIKEPNFILDADGYKTSHWEQMPKNTTNSYVVVVPRKPSKYAEEIVAVGQTIVAEILAKTTITMDMIDEAELEITEQGYTFNRDGWEYIVKYHNGKLPLVLFGVEEGKIIKPQTPIMGVMATDQHAAWLPTYIETWMQQIIWKQSTVASLCRTIRNTIKNKIELTGADMANLEYSLINFGDRGADSPMEAPVLAGIAHAIFFSGSDCIRTNGWIKTLYNTNKAYTSSIKASEHAVMCQHSDTDNKNDFGAAKMAVNMLKDCVLKSKTSNVAPMYSVVIDTYDSRRFVKDFIGTQLKDEVINSGGTLVLRPDSNDPTIEPGLVGNDVEATFGVSLNDKGYKVLPDYINVLQGDGNRIDTFEGILDGWINAGFSMDGFKLGMGSGITHDNARDDFSFSMKAVAEQKDNTWRKLLKEPITDLGKKSLSGLVYCDEIDGELKVLDALDAQLYNSDSPIKPNKVWKLWCKDGFRYHRQTFDQVRALARGE